MQEKAENLKTEKEFKFNDISLAHIDGVLVYVKEAEEVIVNARERFLELIQSAGIMLERKKNDDYEIVYLECSFDALCEAAENANLRLPIELKSNIDDESNPGCCQRLEDKYLVTDGDIEDFMSTRFRRSALPLFKDHDDPEKLFSRRLRLLLTYHILINADITDSETKSRIHGEGRKPKTKALHYLLIHGWIRDYIIPHDPSAESYYFATKKKDDEADDSVDELFHFGEDQRALLNRNWVHKWRYQPLWGVREYFGEKLAFYFAWSGHLITYLWFPVLFGLVCFVFGLVKSVDTNAIDPYSNYNVTSDLARVQLVVAEMLQQVKKSFDNGITPVYACVVCIWGTIFTETWKRLSARISFEWDANVVNELEPDRPQFIGTAERRDPITNLVVDYFPMHLQFLRFLGSITILVCMLVLVFGSAISIIVYRIIVTVLVCPGKSSLTCLFLNLVLSSVLNAIAIIILGKIYDILAVKLTKWENHRTQSQYETALIVKLFTFQFVNSYSSLVYIAFFRGWRMTNGIFDMGSQYVDTCGLDNNCMAMLSFQVMILMIIKPLPKFLKDVILPLVLRCIRRKRKKSAQVESGELGEEYQAGGDLWVEKKKKSENYVMKELEKPVLDSGEFTIGEYMEKVIMYGYLVLFAASFPLAPLLALLTLFADIRVDASRLLWLYRRPVPLLASGIGIWQSIVETLNFLGIVSNSFIIGFVSSWGRSLSLTDRLIATAGIEHGLLAIKLITRIIIPDIPQDVRVNMRREKYFVGVARDNLHKKSKNNVGNNGKDGSKTKLGTKSNISSFDSQRDETKF